MASFGGEVWGLSPNTPSPPIESQAPALASNTIIIGLYSHVCKVEKTTATSWDATRIKIAICTAKEA